MVAVDVLYFSPFFFFFNIVAVCINHISLFMKQYIYGSLQVSLRLYVFIYSL